MTSWTGFIKNLFVNPKKFDKKKANKEEEKKEEEVKGNNQKWEDAVSGE